jgi:Tfp pilus assembly protein PilX
MNTNKSLPSTHKQSGAALAMALTILIILTLLGVSAMKSSSLEIKMATGLQDQTMVLQSADSGLAYAIQNGGLDPTAATQVNYVPRTGIDVTITTETIGTSEPERNSGFSSQYYEALNFEQTSVARIPSSGALATVHQGFTKMRAKN